MASVAARWVGDVVKLTVASLPEWRSLFHALLPEGIHADELAKPWVKQEEEVAGWFSRSAWSLARVAMWRQQKSAKDKVTVFVPDFFCNASLAPLRAMGVRLVFYPITSNMQPDYRETRKQAKSNPPDLFVLVHYFGCPAPAAPTRDFCRNSGAWLIEDAAHVMWPVSGVGKFADFILYSPHKLLPIPDGAVLVARPDGPGKLGIDGLAAFGDPTTWYEQLNDLSKSSVLRVQTHARLGSTWFVKRTLQKFGVRGYKPAVPYLEASHELEDHSSPLSVPAMSAAAQRILKSLLPSLGQIAQWRLRNQLLWDELLLGDHAGKNESLSATVRPNHREWTPYHSAYKVDERDAKRLFESMQRAELPVMTWPDLPPEVCANREVFEEAWRLRHSQIYLPLHQSLSAENIIASVNIQQGTSIKSCNVSVELSWDTVTRTQWHDWMVQVGRSNLLQSWDYGEAKAAVEGWKVRRGVFRVYGEPVAIVQVLEKRCFGAVKVSRVNRGPLFFCEPDKSVKREVFRCLLVELSGMHRGRLLSFAPELPLTGASICMMSKLGFRQFKPNGRESIWLDLNEDSEKLRKKLDGKWRNMLSFAERQGLRLVVERDEASFEWILEKCDRMMRTRSAADVPSALYQSLWHSLKNENQPVLVFRVFADDEAAAGICVVPHGSAATYLLGWNGKQGRKLKANQFLLWNAITFLQQEGFRWFDLGGINEEKTPGIASFKLGVNGVRYALVGELWKW